jgi:3-phosphoshikimate 1-carboxyvinyltransferase
VNSTLTPITISHPTKNIGEKILNISGSKSESNRVLILQALLKGKKLAKYNLSNSQDTELMQTALASKAKEINIHHAGTAMRFLTAYFAVQVGREITLTGSDRMKQRPIGILVDALQQLGADIEYEDKNNIGFPPLKIIGKKLTKNEVTLSANVSSQYISALMLIGIVFEEGLIINLEGKITSYPYLNMTIETINQIGKITESPIQANWMDGEKQSIKVFNGDLRNLSEINKDKFGKKVFVESDWSSASYLYSILALANQGSVRLESFIKSSLQGDSALIEIYKKHFKVETTFEKDKFVDSLPQIKLTKINGTFPARIELDLNHCPDIAQTILVTAAALKIPCKLTGLHTLKIKETDRLAAMQKELAKCNVKTIITDNSIEITHIGDLPEKATIETYNDHRMAMAFAPLALMGLELTIENKTVVEKSYPNFWMDMELLGFTTQ